MRRAALALGAVGLAGCSLGAGASRGATSQGRDIFGLWQLSVGIGLAVGGIVWGLIVYAFVRYRRRSDELPSQRQYLVKLEVVYTVIPLLLVGMLFALSYRTQRDVDRLAAHPDVRIDVLGFQWQWQFRYRDEGLTVAGAPDRPAQMVLPVDRTTRLVLRSRDVVHSFYVPDFNFKRDAIPGVTNRFDLRPDRTGTFVGRCAEFCGLNHAVMTFDVKVVSAADFRQWVGRHRTPSGQASR